MEKDRINQAKPEHEAQQEHGEQGKKFQDNTDTMDEWTPIAKYAPEFIDTQLDLPD